MHKLGLRSVSLNVFNFGTWTHVMVSSMSIPCKHRAITSQFIAIHNTLKYLQTAMLPVLQYFPFP